MHLSHVIGFGEAVLGFGLVVNQISWRGMAEEEGTLSCKCLMSSFTDSIT